MRDRFVDLVERQLDLFEEEHAGLLSDVEAALGAYDRAPRGEAEERYGDFLDLVETGTDELIEVREDYAASLDVGAALVTRRCSTISLGADCLDSGSNWTSRA